MNAGGWNISPTVNTKMPEMQAEHHKIFSEAFAEFVGAGYKPLIHVGQQVVSGMNHLYIAQQTLVIPGESKRTLVKVVLYVPLDGRPVITSIEAI